MASRIKTDITVRFVPNILEDAGRRLVPLSFKRSWTIRRYLRKSGMDWEGMRIAVNGHEIKSLRRKLNSGDEIVVFASPEWGPIGVFVAWFAEHWFTYTMVAMTIATTTYSIVSALMMRNRLPSFDTLGDGLDEGPAYSFDGPRTTADVGLRVPIVYGTRLVGGNIINEYVSTDGDKNYLNTLVAISEGEVDSITLSRINKNPAANFSNYTLDTRLGTNDQSIIPSFEDLHYLKSVGVQLAQNTPYVYTTEKDDVEAFKVHIEFPSGLWQQDANGAIASWQQVFTVEYRVSGVGDYVSAGTLTVDAKSRTKLERILRKEGLTAAQYDIKVTKTSADSDFNHSGDAYLQYVDEINTDDIQYNHTALAGVRTLAVEQLSGANPSYEFLERGTKVMVPKVMNGAAEVGWDDYYWDPDVPAYRLLADDTILTWDGTTYVTRYSANPIWCLLDLMTNTRYGIGRHIELSDGDLDQLAEMAQHCEERVPDGAGGWEKQYRMDIAIDSPQRALRLIFQLASVFRCLPFYSDQGKVRLVIDKLETPVQLFGMGNIAEASFSESWGSRREIPTHVEVEFDDQDKYYVPETIEVEDPVAVAAGKTRFPKPARYYGTKLSYAIRHGRNAIKDAKLTQSVKFRSAGGAIVRRCGEVIDVSHDVPQYGFSGVVKVGSTTTVVKLDRTITIEESKSYKILVDMGEGVLEERTVTDAAGDYTQVTVSPALSQAPAAHDKYAFGEATKVVKPYRIMALRRLRNFEVEIEAREYNEEAYDDSTVVIPQTNYSALEPEIPPVTDLALTERVITLNDGTVESCIDVWFKKPNMTNHYVRNYIKAKIYLSDNSGASHQVRGETDGEHFAIIGDLVVGTEYLITVVSVAGGGEEGKFADAPQDTITLAGKDSPPAGVTNFAYTFTNELAMGWDKNTEKDLAGYEIRTEDANWGVQSGTLVYRGLTNKFTIVAPASRAPGTYYIRAYNRSLVYSEASVSITPTNAAPAAPSIAATQWFGFAKIEWSDAVDADLRYYEVYKSHTNAWGGEEFLETKTPGKAATVQGNAPVDAAADAADATSITDADLIGKGVDYFVGDVIVQTSGTYKGQEAVVTAFNNTTGQVSVASWPSGTPDVGDEFVLKDRAYYKARGVDTYGPGSFSAAVTINFTPLSEAEIGDAIISARKLIAGEVIALTAQIKDLVVTNAKIFDLNGSKIVAETITLAKLAAEAIPPKTYYQAAEPDSGMREGDYWVDTDADNKLYIYQSAAWVEVSASAGGVTVFRQASIPTSTAVGDVWIDSDDGDKLYRAASVGADEIAAGEWVLIDMASATGWAHTADITKIDGGDIYTGSVTADKITVAQLDALVAATGSLTVDETITVGTNKVVIDGANEIITIKDASLNVRVRLGKLS